MQKKIKVLIVEDNEDERLFMKQGFTDDGHYEVIGEANNGEEAIELLHSKEQSLPELVITDLNMHGKNGYEVIADVKANTEVAHIPVVVVTSAPYVPFAERCKKLGACAFFTKPETFLDYKQFAGKIYNDIITRCLPQ